MSTARPSALRRIAIAAVLLAPLSAALPLAAQELASPAAAGVSASPADTITFGRAIGIALSQSATIRQAKNANALDAASVQQQKMQFLPDLRLSTSGSENLGRNFSSTEGRIIDQSTQSVSAGLSSSMTLFDGFANVASLRQAQRTEEASDAELERAGQTVVFTVASDFLTLVAQREQLRVQQQNLASLEAQEAQIERFVAAGSRPISDLYQQQASVAEARAAVVEGRRAVEVAEMDLVATLQLDARDEYEFVAPEVDERSVQAATFDLDALLDRAYAARADLDAQESRVEAAEQGVKAASASRWPTVSLGVGYNSNYTTSNDLAFVDQLDQQRGGSISIGISIPLFDRGSSSIAAERAEIAADNARLALETRRQQVALEVHRALLDFEAAKERLTAAQAGVRAADLAVQTSQQRYEAGAATLVELTQARATQVQAASALVNARYTLAFASAMMSYYTGDLEPSSASLRG